MVIMAVPPEIVVSKTRYLVLFDANKSMRNARSTPAQNDVALASYQQEN